MNYNLVAEIDRLISNPNFPVNNCSIARIDVNECRKSMPRRTSDREMINLDHRKRIPELENEYSTAIRITIKAPTSSVFEGTIFTIDMLVHQNPKTSNYHPKPVLLKIISPFPLCTKKIHFSSLFSKCVNPIDGRLIFKMIDHSYVDIRFTIKSILRRIIELISYTVTSYVNSEEELDYLDYINYPPFINENLIYDSWKNSCQGINEIIISYIPAGQIPKGKEFWVLNIRTPIGDEFPIHVDPNWPTEWIKFNIQDILGIPAIRVRLISAGICIFGDEPIKCCRMSYYKAEEGILKNNCIVFAVFRKGNDEEYDDGSAVFPSKKGCVHIT